MWNTNVNSVLLFKARQEFPRRNYFTVAWLQTKISTWYDVPTLFSAYLACQVKLTKIVHYLQCEIKLRAFFIKSPIRYHFVLFFVWNTILCMLFTQYFRFLFGNCYACTIIITNSCYPVRCVVGVLLQFNIRSYQ